MKTYSRKPLGGSNGAGEIMELTFYRGLIGVVIFVFAGWGLIDMIETFIAWVKRTWIVKGIWN